MEKTNIKNKKDGLNIKSKTKKPLRGKKFPIRLSKIKYEEKIVQIKRVTKVVKGGKKMTFRAVVII
jgi:ribosomal protein S5